MVVRIKLLSPLECNSHTLLQLLQRGLYQRLILILMAKKKTETKIPHDCSNRGEYSTYNLYNSTTYYGL